MRLHQLDHVLRRVEALPAGRVEFAVFHLVNLDLHLPVVAGHHRGFECRQKGHEAPLRLEHAERLREHRSDVVPRLGEDGVDRDHGVEKGIIEREVEVVGEHEVDFALVEVPPDRLEHPQRIVARVQFDVRQRGQLPEQERGGSTPHVQDAAGPDFRNDPADDLREQQRREHLVGVAGAEGVPCLVRRLFGHHAPSVPSGPTTVGAGSVGPLATEGDSCMIIRAAALDPQHHVQSVFYQSHGPASRRAGPS